MSINITARQLLVLHVFSQIVLCISLAGEFLRHMDVIRRNRRFIHLSIDIGFRYHHKTISNVCTYKITFVSIQNRYLNLATLQGSQYIRQ